MLWVTDPGQPTSVYFTNVLSVGKALLLVKSLLNIGAKYKNRRHKGQTRLRASLYGYNGSDGNVGQVEDETCNPKSMQKSPLLEGTEGLLIVQDRSSLWNACSQLAARKICSTQGPKNNAMQRPHITEHNGALCAKEGSPCVCGVGLKGKSLKRFVDTYVSE